MRIDPSQLAQPLAHVLGTSSADAATGGRVSGVEAGRADGGTERLDEALLRRLRAASMESSAAAVANVDEIRELVASFARVAVTSPGDVASAHGALDSARVRGLLGQ